MLTIQCETQVSNDCEIFIELDELLPRKADYRDLQDALTGSGWKAEMFDSWEDPAATCPECAVFDPQFYESEQDQAQTNDPSMRPDLVPVTISYLERACDDYGVYNYRDEKIGSTCNCEDYPCCGH